MKKMESPPTNKFIFELKYQLKVDDIIIKHLHGGTDNGRDTNLWFLRQRQYCCNNDNKVQVFKLQNETDDKTGNFVLPRFRPTLGLPWKNPAVNYYQI